MNATEFTKNKMHFTIALLGALFALHPFFHVFDKISFVYMGVVVPLSYALIAIGVLLAGAVYCYATDLMTESPSPLSQRLGNYLYATAMMTVPFYAGLWLTTLLETWLIREHVLDEYQMKAPVITVGVLAVWIVLWQLGGWYIRHYLSKKDWTSRIDQMADREMDALKRAQDLRDHGHIDLAVIQYYKAVLTRLRMAEMKMGVFETEPKIMMIAKKAGILNKANEEAMNELSALYSIARSDKPVGPGSAERAQENAQKVLSTVAV